MRTVYEGLLALALFIGLPFLVCAFRRETRKVDPEQELIEKWIRSGIGDERCHFIPVKGDFYKHRVQLFLVKIKRCDRHGVLYETDDGRPHHRACRLFMQDFAPYVRHTEEPEWAHLSPKDIAQSNYVEPSEPWPRK